MEEKKIEVKLNNYFELILTIQKVTFMLLQLLNEGGKQSSATIHMGEYNMTISTEKAQKNDSV
jgi:hypothetical protein